MAEESRMPPPPPRSSKPVPPPPPGRGAVPPAPPSPMGGTAAPMTQPPAAGKPGPAPIPFPPGGSPVGAMPGMPGPRAVDPRVQEMERRLQDQDEARKKMEEKTRELEYQLKEEHEKVIMQSLKAKEEESLSVRVDQQLREMQEKLRREKYEQELQESRGKAENQLKDLERRIAEERETWMTALKNQLKERDVVEQEVEQSLTRRLRDTEQRYQEEKNQWLLSLKQKEDELNQDRRRFELEMAKLKEKVEDQEEGLKAEKEADARERHALDMQHQAEYRALQAQYETQMRETGSWKAQIALVQSQLQQVDVQHTQDRARMEKQLRDKEEELKREFSQRDHERTQYWEGILNQMKSEKDTMRASTVRREEESTRLQVELADLKRKIEVERAEWQTGIEKARRVARDEALRDLPQVFDDRLKAVQAQMAKAAEGHKILQSKFDVEQRRWEQQKATLVQNQQQLEQDKVHLSAELQHLKADFEKQTKELFNHIAASQMKESAVREELERNAQKGREQEAAWLDEKGKIDALLAAATQDAAMKEDQIQHLDEEMSRLRTQADDFSRQIEENRAKEELWKTSQTQLTTAFHNVQNELVKLQNEHTLHENAWSAKEEQWKEKETQWNEKEAQWAGKVTRWEDKETQWAEKERQWIGKEAQWAGKEALAAQKDAQWMTSKNEWEKAKAEWEKSKAELEKAKAEWMVKAQNQPVAVPATVSPEAQKALASIRQQMQDLRTIFASMRPAA